MIKRPHNYSGGGFDCTDKEQCRFRYECPFIDNESRLKSHRKKGFVVRYMYGCVHYRALGAGGINEESESC
jgi:hypothetical protein